MSEGSTQDDEHDGFGACCHELQAAISGEEFEPLLTVAEDGVLYMSIGVVDMSDGDEEGQEFVDHPVFFCPFCGTKLQVPEDVVDRMQQGAADDGGQT